VLVLATQAMNPGLGLVPVAPGANLRTGLLLRLRSRAVASVRMRPDAFD
jgi:hypothetical protein